MKSAMPKVLHEVAGRPMLGGVLDVARAAGCEPIVAIVGHGGDQVRARSGRLRRRLGRATRAARHRPRPRPGSAARSARSRSGCSSSPGDVPLVRPETLWRAPRSRRDGLGRDGGRDARRARLARPGDREGATAPRPHRRSGGRHARRARDPPRQRRHLRPAVARDLRLSVAAPAEQRAGRALPDRRPRRRRARRTTGSPSSSSTIPTRRWASTTATTWRASTASPWRARRRR